MELDYIYWNHVTPAGVRVEEITGREDKKGKLWLAMAYQVYCANGKDGFREIGHYENGAPYLEGEDYRISISHTEGLLAVASLPVTRECDLSEFSPRSAMGIDVERLDREKAYDLRERFLSEPELALVGEGDRQAALIAWTAKEALYKAAMTPGLDWRESLVIQQLPEIAETPGGGKPGLAELRLPDGVYPMELYTYASEGCAVTIAVSPKAAKFKS